MTVPEPRPDPTEPWRQLYRATVGAVSDDDLAFYRQLGGWTVESARRVGGRAALLARMAPRCGELAAQIPRRMTSGGLPSDPLEFTLRLYDATNAPLSAMIRDLLTDEAFLQLSRRLQENWVTAESLLARLSEDLLQRLHLTTRADVTRIATLIIGLDEKVDRLDDTVDDLDEGADAAELARLREQVGRLEAKLDQVLAARDPEGAHR